MTNQEKEDFCQLLACLFHPPDEDLIGQIHRGNLHCFFEKYVQDLEGDGNILKCFRVLSG